MNLYKIKTLFLGKDLNNEAELGLLVAENDSEVFDFISKRFSHWHWRFEDEPNELEGFKQYVIAHNGDFKDDYHGEFYDQKYGWVCLGPVTEQTMRILESFGLMLK